MLILNKKQIEDSISILDVLEAVERAFLLQESGDFLMPDRMHVEHNGNVLLLMPAFAGDRFATKLVSVFPENKKQNLPVIYGTVMLNDGKTGKPLAMLEGSSVTALRTGAVGGLGIAYTTPKDINTVGLIGAGIQGFHQILFAAVVRNITDVHFYDPFLKDAGGFLNKLKKYLPHINFHRKESAREVVANSEVVVTATTSTTPVIPDDKKLIKGKHFIGIGSYQPDMREFPDALFELLNTVLIDTGHATGESGDVRIPLETGMITEDQIVRIGRVINKEAEIDTSRTTFFKSVGMALFDLLTAEMIYSKAREKGLGTEVAF